MQTAHTEQNLLKFKMIPFLSESPLVRSPIVVLCAVDPVVGVEGDLLALHVPLAHHAHKAAMMEHKVPDTQRVIRTHIASTLCTAA